MAEKNEFFQSKEVLDFNKDLEQYNLGPLWTVIPEIMHWEPTPQAIPYLWKWETLHKKLMEASTIFTPDRGGERRAIFFQNPGLLYRQPCGWASTTHTLYAAVQLILPGETAPSHRHSQSALRFIHQGQGAYTIVNGERLFMEEGDFLTTPQWFWHGHAHTGEGPMIWMDCLDIPYIYSTGGTFFEPHPGKIEQPSVPDDFSPKRYAGGMVRPISDHQPQPAVLGAFKWQLTQQTLQGMSEFEPDPYDGHAVEYINPSTALSATPNIGAWMQLLPKGYHSKAHRHTSSSIYHVYSGSGYTVINGVRFNWSKGDFFIVPNWAWHEHVNTGNEEAYLFCCNDIPIMERLNLQKEQAYTENNGHQNVTGEFTPQLA